MESETSVTPKHDEPVRERIKLSAIEELPELQNRNPYGHTSEREDEKRKNAKALSELKQDMGRRGQTTPIIVVPNPHTAGRKLYWLVSGHHRCKAARQLGWKEIDAEVYEGGFRKAWELSKVANMDVYLPMPRSHKTQNAWDALVNPASDYFRTLSAREAAKELGVSHPTIGKMKKRIEEEVGKVTPQDLASHITSDPMVVVHAKNPFWAAAKAYEPRGDEVWIHKLEVDERVAWLRDQLDLEGEDSPGLRDLRVISEALSLMREEVGAQIQAIQQGRKASSAISCSGPSLSSTIGA